MAVTASLKDRDGQILDAKVTSLTAAMNAMPSGSAGRASMNAQIEQAQNECVMHYIKVGRIQSSAILSTLS